MLAAEVIPSIHFIFYWDIDGTDDRADEGLF